MDQIIEQEVTARKKKKGIMIGLIAVLVLAGSIWLMRATLKSSIKRSDITTAVVELGQRGKYPERHRRSAARV
jgi:HlyD family secretion protein